MPMRGNMRGSVEPTGTMLSKNNLLRSSQTLPAPIRRSDSSRIETWRDEVNCCCSPGAAGHAPLAESSPKDRKELHTGKLSRVASKVFKRRSTHSESLHSGKEGDVTRTSMYDGNRPGERMMDDWEEGAGESMYFGSLGESEGGRLDRAEQLLNRGCGDGEKKVEDEVKGVQQATA